jgi:NAD(P)H-dependent FMN reductase
MILLLSLSANPKSHSRRAARIFQGMLDAARIQTRIVDVRSLTPIWVDGRALKEYPKEYGELNEIAEAASGIVLAMPIYDYSASSPAKAIIEILGKAIVKKPVAFITSAGTHRSHLAVRDVMSSLIFGYEAICYPKSVQLTSDDFLNDITLKDIANNRLFEMAKAFPEFIRAITTLEKIQLT